MTRPIHPHRNKLLLSGALQGKVANNPDDLKSVIFGRGFGTISDIEVGPVPTVTVAITESAKALSKPIKVPDSASTRTTLRPCI